MTPANLLTLARALMVPVLVILLVYDRPRLALGLFVVAGLTDILDGFVARQFNQRSRLGTILDPLADKALLVCMFIVLSLPSLDAPLRIPLWLTIVVLSRDILLVVAVIVVNLTLGQHIFPPSRWGKYTTFFQLTTVFSVLMANAFGVIPFGVRILFLVTLALTVVSGLHYLSRGWRLMDFQKQPAGMPEQRG